MQLWLPRTEHPDQVLAFTQISLAWETLKHHTEHMDQDIGEQIMDKEKWIFCLHLLQQEGNSCSGRIWLTFQLMEALQWYIRSLASRPASARKVGNEPVCLGNSLQGHVRAFKHLHYYTAQCYLWCLVSVQPWDVLF